MTNSTRGKLINFRPQSVQSRFVNTTLDDTERRRYVLNLSKISGKDRLVVLIRELIDDWGTGLDASVYRRAILHCLSEEVVPERMLPMRCDERAIGNQRFQLLDRETALGVTTFHDPNAANIEDFRKLLAASPLRQFHWINVARHHVNVCTTRHDRKI
jgi:hypothetical protein